MIKVCYLCGNKKFTRVNGKLRDDPRIKILRCDNCTLVFLETQDHINDIYYEDSKMRGNESYDDWSVWLKKCRKDDMRRVKLLEPLVGNKHLLDFGCGSGGTLMGLKDVAASVAGVELEKYFRDILNEHDIPTYRQISDIKKKKFDVITLFHVIEHLKDPKSIFKEIKKYSHKGGEIIIETPNANDALLSLYNSKLFSEYTYWSCHLFLYNNFTLRKVMEDAGFTVNYVKQIQRYPLSNHLNWISNGLPSNHKNLSFLDTEGLHKEYEMTLANIGACDTLLASVTPK